MGSIYLRARQTAECIADVASAPMLVHEALREIDCGVLDGRADDAAWAIQREVLARWCLGERDARFPGGESYGEACDRLADFLAAVMRDHPCEGVAVVGHGGLFGSVVPRLCPIPVDRPTELRNTSVTVLHHGGEGLSCERWGCVEHLTSRPQANRAAPGC